MATEAELLAADSRARDAALDVTRSFIVQAPAGSGKTELLIQRYLKLLGTVAEPEEVVAITFTNKAANEMQARVVGALERAARGETAVAEHEQRTLEAAAVVLGRDAERGWRLLDSPRRLRIQTLDAFCASITRLLPVSSGLGGSLATNADAAMQRLYRDAATATLDWLPGDSARAAALKRVLQHLDSNVTAYIEYLARMLAKRDQWLSIVGSGAAGDDELAAVRAALERDIERQVCARLALLRDAFDRLGSAGERALLCYAGEHLAESSGESQPLAGLSADAWPGATGDDVAPWRAIADALLTQQGDLRRTVNKNTGFPPRDSGEKAAFMDWLGRLRAEPGLAALLASVRELPDTRYRDDQWAVLVALFRVLPLAVAELERLFAGQGVTDHVQVARAASAALGSVDEPGELAMLLDYRIRHLLVDEMQDTSIGQYGLLAQLTAGWEPGDGRTLFCVGDPMQSIYRFRDAAVGQFVAARSHGIGEVALESLVLRRNFRSGERLVDWYNAVFPEVLPGRDDISSGAIAYTPCVSVEAHAGLGAVEVHPLIDADPVAEASCSAEVIERCLAADDGDVAVLVRSRTQLPQLLADLRHRGIPCEAIEIDRLTDLPEIIELLALTRALSHDGDRLAWLSLLRAPWCGLGWADLQRLVRNDRTSTLRELAASPERLEELSGDGRERLLAFLGRLAGHDRAHGVRSLRERIECLWLALGGAAALQSAGQLENAYRFLDVLEKIEFAGTLPDVATLESQLDAERVSTLVEGGRRVQVMTMHKAKGLQFDHVVLHALGRQPASGDRDVLAWLTLTHDDGSSGIVLSPLGPRAARESDPLHRFIERAARESDGYEVGRLLYVACTRAVRSLHLVGSTGTRKHGAELASPPASTLLYRLWPLLAEDYEAAFAARSPAGENAKDGENTFVSPRLRRLAFDAAPLPAVPPGTPAAAGKSEQPVDYEWVGTAARHAGTIVHRWLQKMADGEVPADRLPQEVAPVSRRWARALGVVDTELDAVAARAAAALEAVIGDDRGRWLLEGDGKAELRLSGLLDGRIANVAIDRVRIDGDTHWLVDYKTGSHEGGDLDGFLRQEAERYRDQLRRYRDIYAGTTAARLKTALYFPLLTRFVEVDVDAAGSTA